MTWNQLVPTVEGEHSKATVLLNGLPKVLMISKKRNGYDVRLYNVLENRELPLDPFLFLSLESGDAVINWLTSQPYLRLRLTA